MLSLDRPDLGYGDLVVGEELQQKRLELLVGPVDLVEQEHRRRLGSYGLQYGTLHKEVLGEEYVLLLAQLRGGLAQALRRTEDLPDLLPQNLRVQELLTVLPLVECLGFVKPLVALQADECPFRGRCERLRKLGLADASGTFHENRLVQLHGQVHHRRQAPVADVLLLREPLPDLFDALEQNAPFREDQSASQYIASNDGSGRMPAPVFRSARRIPLTTEVPAVRKRPAASCGPSRGRRPRCSACS